MVCESCVGKNETRFDLNPEFGEVDIIFGADGEIILPRPLRPENICFEGINNVDFDGDAVDSSEAQMVGWDETNCKIKKVSWPCPVFEEWDRAVIEEPDTAACEECPRDGKTVFFLEVQSGCITHICVDGQVVCLGTTEEEETQDKVCYDTADCGFPMTYGGQNGGFWDVFGENVMNEPCSDTGVNQFDLQAPLEYACFGDYGGSSGPNGGWNSLAWTNDTFNTAYPTPPTVEATQTSHPCARPAFRMNPGFTAGTTGPICWDIDFFAPVGDTRFAAYDKISGQQLTPTIVSVPAGSTVLVETGPNGQHIHAPSTAAGFYKYCFDLNSVPGAQAENICLLAWNMGHDGSNPEGFQTVAVTANPTSGDCCNEWENIEQMLVWMNANSDQNWFLEGTKVCGTMPLGVGQNYGDLASCECTMSPSLEVVGTDIFCPNCVQIERSGNGDIEFTQSLLDSFTYCEHRSICGRQDYPEVNFVNQINTPPPFTILATATATVTNPSGCRPMPLLWGLTYDAGWAGGSFYGGQYERSYGIIRHNAFNNGTTIPPQFGGHDLSWDFEGTIMAIDQSRSDLYCTIIPPGGTATIGFELFLFSVGFIGSKIDIQSLAVYWHGSTDL